MTTDKNAFISSISGRVAVIMILISAGAWITGFSEVRELLSLDSLQAAQPLAPPPTYELRLVGGSRAGIPTISIDRLNSLGKEGWRLLPIYTRRNNSAVDKRFYCERETSNTASKVKYEYKSADHETAGFGGTVETGGWRVRMVIPMLPKDDDYFIMERELD